MSHATKGRGSRTDGSRGSQTPECLQEEVGRLTKQLREQKLVIDELTAKLGAQAAMIASRDEQLRRRERSIERERQIAHEILERILPFFLPEAEGIRLAVRYHLSEEAGGDIYDAIEMGHGCLGLLVADVCGSGLTAALLAVMSKMAFRSFASHELAPLAIMEDVNRCIYDQTLDGQFLTCFFGVLDCQSMRMKYVNASHCPPILLRDGKCQTLDTEGLFVGMFESPKYEEKSVQLRAGDKLFFYTDGATDAENEQKEAFSTHRLIQSFLGRQKEGIEAIVDGVMADLEAYRGGRPFEDDATFLGLEAISKEAEFRTVTVPSDPAELLRIEEAIIPALEERGYGQRSLFGVKLAIEEAVINAMMHGNKMDKTKDVTVRFKIDGEKLLVEIEDEGRGFDPHSVPDPTLDENLEIDHGRGIILMRAYMDRVEYNERGNVVSMVKYAPWMERQGKESEIPDLEEAKE